MPKRNLNEKMAFDKWFVMNYSRLKEKIGLGSIFDADAFHDAYLTLATSKDLPSVAEDYSKIFLTTYRKVSRRALNECYTICHPDELFFTLLPDIEEEKGGKRPYQSGKEYRQIHSQHFHIDPADGISDEIAGLLDKRYCRLPQSERQASQGEYGRRDM